jgi:DNA-directed RNA polymerase specialized sigma subunit
MMSLTREHIDKYGRDRRHLKPVLWSLIAWGNLPGEGQLGLMRALCRFDPHQGVAFTTYTTWWVTVTLQEYVPKNARPIGRARASELLRAEFGRPPIRRSPVAAKPDLPPRQQTVSSTAASNDYRLAADATCGRT